jgi:hypothetical protein
MVALIVRTTIGCQGGLGSERSEDETLYLTIFDDIQSAANQAVVPRLLREEDPLAAPAKSRPFRAPSKRNIHHRYAPNLIIRCE